MQGKNSTKPVGGHDWLQALFDASPMPIGFSRDGVMLDANPAYVRLFGYESAAELRGTSLLGHIAPSHRERILELIAQRARGDSVPDRYETRGLRRDKTEFPFEITTTRVLVADGPLAIAFISDVSERQAALDAVKASDERFRMLSAAALEGVFVHADGKILLTNAAAAAMYGFEPDGMNGLSLMDFTAPESRSVVADHIRRGDPGPYEGIGVRRDGTTFIAEVRGRTLVQQGRPMRVTTIRDITDRKRIDAEQHALAERVRQGQKLESLGMLAGGVAHDFNNLLTVITNGVALAKREAERGMPSMAHLDAVALAAERAAEVCRQMQAYAGQAQLARVVVQLNTLVDEMSSMLQASIAKKVTLVRDLAPNLPTLLGDGTQLRQVVMNLVLNASESISGAHGTIRVSTGTGTYDAGSFVSSVAGGDPKTGAYVWLEVQDDGVGMDAATIAQLFDPFFTTKFVGRGLGMAVVLGIVRGHGGAIDVESSPGKGTRIRAFFPASAGESVGTPSQAPKELRGQGVVLVVDDEKNVRTTTQLLLRHFGFTVLVACDGIEAIEVLRAQSAPIDVVLLDLTMPRMDGIETMRELRRIAPQVPVVLTSGYGSTPFDDESGQNGGPDAVLSKPYSADELVGTLLRVIRG